MRFLPAFRPIVGPSLDLAKLLNTNFLEAAIAIDAGRSPVASRRLDDLIRAAQIVIEPVTYGRGSGHPARLNFGDCFAYALACATGEMLLFKSEDFRHIDVISALR